MRDVREDWELGRVYLPQDELEAYGVSEDDIANGRVTSEWRALMAFNAQRARAYLAEGLELLDSLDSRSALCVSTFAGLYRATLDRIEANGYDVFGESCRLSTPAKLAVVARGLLRAWRRRSSGAAWRDWPRVVPSLTAVFGSPFSSGAHFLVAELPPTSIQVPGKLWTTVSMFCSAAALT